MPKLFPALPEDSGEIREVVAGRVHLAYSRTAFHVRSAHVLQVEIRNCLRKGKNRMLCIISRPEQAQLLAKKRNEHDRPFGPPGQRCQRVGNLDHR